MSRHGVRVVAWLLLIFMALITLALLIGPAAPRGGTVPSTTCHISEGCD